LERERRDTGRVVPSDWDKIGDCAKDVRAALVRDQDGLCAYCGRRLIRPPQDREEQPRESGPHDAAPGSVAHPPSGLNSYMKIEHFEARSIVPERMFDWDNLLGVCSGHFVIQGRVIETCDSARGNRKLHVHPVTHPRDPTELFPVHDGHLSDALGRPCLGAVIPHDKDADAIADTATLNLNASPLIDDRARVIRDLRVLLSRDDSLRAIRRLLDANTLVGSDGLPPYAHVAAAYLRKKLRAR